MEPSDDNGAALADSAAARALGADGPFAASIAGFKPRRGQQRLASAVEQALEGRGKLVAEAGTGVGKTFAYLVPALLSGEKVIVSTGTRHLQDQLFSKDLPVVSGQFARRPRVALLKGRANYLCRHRLERARHSAHLSDPGAQAKLAHIARWAERTRSGDIAELSQVAEDDPIWSAVTSSVDVCADHEAAELDGCFVHAARQAAQAADLVVVNHHLFCADLALKEEGFGEVLPSAGAFVFDEAHQLPEVASSFFGKRLASRQIVELARDVSAAQLEEAPDQTGLRHLAEVLERAMRDLRLALGPERRRAAWVEVADDEAVAAALAELGAAFAALGRALEGARERGRALEACHKRCGRLSELLAPFAGDGDGEESAQITWFETYATGFSLNLTPLDIAGPFARAMAALPAAWVFTSATLTVKDDFGHFCRQLGISGADTCLAESPFNYRENAMLYAPPGLPEPSAPGFNRAVLAVAERLIAAAGGRCFVLFTSHRALSEAAEHLQARIDYPLFVQGRGAKNELLEGFRRAGDGVLLGTASFWEGVDVRGRALGCVIIDKLPFGSPGDPVTRARIEAMERAGLNPFMHYQLPRAITQLKQGVGRLIRDEADRGVLAICDPRLTTRQYGSLFLNSLPRMHRTRLGDKVEAFLSAERAAADGA